MSNTIVATRQDYASIDVDAQLYEDDMEPYLSLFMKPLTNKKCEFSSHDLEAMCKDPLHSPKLILYLIEFVKEL